MRLADFLRPSHCQAETQQERSSSSDCDLRSEQEGETVTDGTDDGQGHTLHKLIAFMLDAGMPLPHIESHDSCEATGEEWMTGRQSERKGAHVPSRDSNDERKGAYITTRDGTELYYKDWGTSQPVVFSHGWPLSADAFEDQMFFLAARGFRCIAHDRRGHGRSSQPWNGNDMDTYADDLAELVTTLGLKDVIHVGHSTGGGEVARYIARYGTDRVAKVVLISSVPPLMLKTPANPGGTPIEAFDKLRSGVVEDRSQFWKDLSLPFYGYNRPGAKISEGVRESFWHQGMMAGFPASYFCIKAFSETDQTEDLKRFNVPTLILAGDDDQIVPYRDGALLQAKLIKGATLKVYRGAPHGIPTTHKHRVNRDLLAFILQPY
jgi:non-heme chloroperoxidase